MNEWIFKAVLASAICVVVYAQEPETSFNSLPISTDNPNVIEIKSENYPMPFPLQSDDKWSFSVDQGIGLQIIIHNLDIDTNSDYLLLKAGFENDTEAKTYRFTGRPNDLPLKFRITNSKSAFMQFVTNHSSPHNFTGFLMSYEPFGETPTTLEPLETTEHVEIRDVLETIKKELTVNNPLDEIFSLKLKNILSNSTNLFVLHHHLAYETCKTENVFFSSITKCPVTWPKSASCISVKFGIRLEPLNEDTEETRQEKSINIPTTQKPDVEYQLSAENLDLMWTEYAIQILSENGIQIYAVPNHLPVLFLWIAVSICVIGAFIFVLYSIWKIDFFKDYKKMSSSQDDNETPKKESEYDISMFPSPHQIVPSLFADVSMEERIRSFSNNNNHLFYTNDAFVYDDNNSMDVGQQSAVPKVKFAQEDDKGENLINRADVYDKVNKNG